MNPIKISVIVPVYNASEFLQGCLDSLVRQTMKDLEIIIIDDGSTDGSGEIVDRYAESHANFKVYHQSNQGIGITRGKAITYVTGEYVGWVDADDFVEPDMYSRLYDVAQQNDADVVSCDYSFYPEKIKTKEKWFKMYQGQVDWYFIECNTQCWNKIVRRELLNELHMDKWYALGGDGAYLMTQLKAHPFRKDSYHEDYALWMELFALPIRVAGDDKMLMRYRQVRGSRSNAKVNAAKKRWEVYCKTLHMGLLESAWAFCWYAVRGAIKYFG